MLYIQEYCFGEFLERFAAAYIAQIVVEFMMDPYTARQLTSATTNLSFIYASTCGTSKTTFTIVAPHSDVHSSISSSWRNGIGTIASRTIWMVFILLFCLAYFHYFMYHLNSILCHFIPLSRIIFVLHEDLRMERWRPFF